MSISAALAGGETFGGDARAYISYFTTKIVFKAKWSLDELIKHLKQKNILKISDTDFEAFQAINREIINEIVTRARFEMTQHMETLPKLSIHDIMNMRKDWATLFYVSIPLCRELMYMVKIAVNAFEMAVNQKPYIDVQLKSSVQKIQELLANEIRLKRHDLRMINGEIKVVESEVALKYYTFEMDLRKKANWRKLFDTGLSEINKVDELPESTDITSNWDIFKGKFEELKKSFQTHSWLKEHGSHTALHFTTQDTTLI